MEQPQPLDPESQSLPPSSPEHPSSAAEYGRSLGEIGASVIEVTSSMSEVLRSEVRLAKAEIKDTGAKLGREAVQVGICVGLVVLGLLPMLSFLVVGLGRILGGMYWLSSLIVGVVFLTAGVAVGLRVFQKFNEGDFLLPETRSTMGTVKELGRKLRSVPKPAQSSDRRAA